MRKLLIWILLLVLVSASLLGCRIQMGSTDTTNNSSDNNSILPAEGKICAPSSPGNALTTYDPNREIYFSCEDMNMDLDIYFWHTWRPGFNFYILSMKELDMDSLDISIPIETTYTVTSSQCNVWQGTEHMADEQGLFDGRVNYNECFPYYLYQVYQGIDFKEATKLFQEKGIAEYQEYIDSPLQMYKMLGTEDIPFFYAYNISVDFAYTCNKLESFSEIVVALESTEYRFDVGEVTLIPSKNLCTTEISEKYFNEVGDASIGQLHYFYNDGLAQDSSAFKVTAKEKMTLTGLNVHGSDMELLDIFVTIASDTPISFQWDGKSPFEIDEGEVIEIGIVFRAENAQHLGYNIQAYFELEFETETEKSCLMKEYVLSPFFANLHELFAIVFMGVDMESYYRDYYYPEYEPWRSEYIN